MTQNAVKLPKVVLHTPHALVEMMTLTSGRPPRFFVSLLGAAMLVAVAAPLTSGVSHAQAVPAERPTPPAIDPNATVPLPGLSLTYADYALVQSALSDAQSGDWVAARTASSRIKDQTARMIIRWLELQDKNSGAASIEITTFLNANQDWPRQDRLERRAEEALLAENPDTGSLLSWFDLNPPITGDGKIRFGEALIEAGDTQRGTQMIRAGWIAHDFESTREAQIIRQHRSTLRREDHIARLDRLLWDKDATDARQMASLVGADHAALAEARIRLARRSAGVDSAVDAVPASLVNDPGLLLERARWRRRNGAPNDAVPLILRAPTTGEEMVRPDEFWRERHLHARRLLKERDYRTAYDLVRNHGMSSGVSFAEGEWLAGWVALRFLNDPTSAYFHFRTLAANVKTPISKARAEYWAGRAAQADGRKGDAGFYYQRASEHDTTFYGQLARQSLLGGDNAITVVSSGTKPPATFNTSSAMAAMKMLNALGEERLVTAFFYHLSRYFEDAGDLEAMAKWLRTAGRPNLAVRTAKIASRKGIELPDYAYPTNALPDVPSAGSPVERALAFGISRQESEFNPPAVSHAGARGLMQLMPGTAKRTANAYGLPYSKSRLLTDPTYNAKIGITHLGDLLDEFGGSYILTIAAYNAGGGRVNEWIATYGDPRTPGIDPIDWVEQIPFSETRNYVQRVLENTQIYRARLAGAPVNVKLIQDLHRAGVVPSAPPAAVPVPTPAPNTQ